MKPYPKIPTVWLRDPDTKNRFLLESQYATPELDYLALCRWEFTEKIDGTNIRIRPADPTEPVGVQNGLEVHGRTDAAQVPPHLLAAIRALEIERNWAATFDREPATLYGEGYGPKIQKGEKYADQPGFILFDVRVGDWWLQQRDVEAIAEELGIRSVPTIGRGSLLDAVEQCRMGFESTFGRFMAEGIVAKPMNQLFNREGERIITKVKCRDFRENHGDRS